MISSNNQHQKAYLFVGIPQESKLGQNKAKNLQFKASKKRQEEEQERVGWGGWRNVKSAWKKKERRFQWIYTTPSHYSLFDF